MEQQAPLLVVDDLHKSYKSHHVLKGVSFSVAPSQVVGLIGRSGSGKSTLLRCLNMLETPDSGRVMLAGREIGFGGTPRRPLGSQALACQRRSMAMVFQHFNLWPHRTVLENVIEGPVVVKGQSRDEASAHALQLLERVGLASKADAYPIHLSGGQQQRVSIARALAMQPQVILFDEPTSALDPELVDEVLGVMLDLARSGATMVVVTHEMSFARAACNQIILLADGEIVAQGSPAQVMDESEDRHAQRFFAKQRAQPLKAG